MKSRTNEAVAFSGNDGLYLKKKFEGHVKIICTQEGFYIKNLEAKEEGFIRKVSFSRVTFPERILKAYGYDLTKDTMMVQQLSNNEVFIIGRRPLEQGQVPKPYPGFKFQGDHKVEDFQNHFDVVYKEAVSNNYDIKLPKDFQVDTLSKITLCMEENREFILIEKATEKDAKRYEKIKDLKSEFGKNLQHFVGEEFIYLQAKVKSFRIPRLFRDRAGIRIGEKVRVIPIDSRRLLIAKDALICAVSGDTMDPIKQTGKEAIVCKECKKKENLSEVNEIIKLLSTIEQKLDQTSKQCMEYKKKCEHQCKENQLLKDENEKMMTRVGKVEDFLQSFQSLIGDDKNEIDL